MTQFLALKTGIKWEDVVIENVSVEDLDKESFDIFKRETVRTGRMTKTDLNMSNREILDSLNLMVGDKITRVGVMLFHRTPDKWVSGCYTKVGEFGKVQIYNFKMR